MRKLGALIIAAMLAGAAVDVATPAHAAVVWHYGHWQRGPGGWVWVGGWGPGGAWVRYRGYWAYRWRPAAWRYAYWTRRPGGWVWVGGWAPSGAWVHYRGGWAYRWR